MRLYISNRAVARYVERWKPQLGEEAARHELEALAALVDAPLPGRPDWVEGRNTASFWVELAPDLVGAVQNKLVTTVIARPGVSLQHRAKKRAARREKRARARWRSDHGKNRYGNAKQWA